MEKIRNEIKKLLDDIQKSNKTETYNKRTSHIQTLLKNAQKLFDIDEKERIHILASLSIASEKLNVAKRLLELPNNAKISIKDNLKVALEYLKEMNHEIKHDEEILKKLEELTK